MQHKPKIAICWLGGCGGCDEAIVDLNENILEVAAQAELVFWPVAMDYKYHHIEAMQNGEIALSIVNGNVRNSDHEEVLRLLRKKSRLLLAFGACACFGGTPGLANLADRETIYNWVYRDAPTVYNPAGCLPQAKTRVGEYELTLPELYDKVYPVNHMVEVDYYLPGCPPPADLIQNAINAVLKGKLPPKGSTLAPHKSLCDSCKRNASKPARLAVKDIKRIHEVEANPDICFLAQGILCMGIVTRDGCGQSCININMPCRGCFGPVEGVEDAGAKFISALASILDVETEEEVRHIVEQIDDVAGYINRFSLPVSTLGRIRNNR